MVLPACSTINAKCCLETFEENPTQQEHFTKSSASAVFNPIHPLCIHLYHFNNLCASRTIWISVQNPACNISQCQDYRSSEVLFISFSSDTLLVLWYFHASFHNLDCPHADLPHEPDRPSKLRPSVCHSIQTLQLKTKYTTSLGLILFLAVHKSSRADLPLVIRLLQYKYVSVYWYAVDSRAARELLHFCILLWERALNGLSFSYTAPQPFCTEAPLPPL